MRFAFACSFVFFLCFFFFYVFFASNNDSSRKRTKSNGWFHGWKYIQIFRFWNYERPVEWRYVCECCCCVRCACSSLHLAYETNGMRDKHKRHECHCLSLLLYNLCACVRMFIRILFDENNAPIHMHTASICQTKTWRLYERLDIHIDSLFIVFTKCSFNGIFWFDRFCSCFHFKAQPDNAKLRQEMAPLSSNGNIR